MMIPVKEKKDNLFSRAWKGEAQLWEAWWIIGLCLLPFSIGLQLLSDVFVDNTLVIHIIFTAQTALQIAWWRVVWICSKNSAKWGILARVLIILGAMKLLSKIL